MIIRTRIAPSPTGFFHIGTARTALFNYLFAKKNGGKFILRIEDTDRERSTKEFEKDIIDGLDWLGIRPDEGPDSGGEYGPYRQSEREKIYTSYLAKLWEEGKIYFCFHSTSELDKEISKAAEEKRPQVHICSYRDTPLENQKRMFADHETYPEYVIRFKTPRGRSIEFDDCIRGKVIFQSDILGDFSIAKDLHLSLYNFAVVVDDYEMNITHVIRGEDHISNTPKQILLCEALGWEPPVYAHLPIILGVDRSKLSKRHGAISLSEYRRDGYLPEALINFMAFLGWNPGDEREIFSLEELANAFSLEKVQKSGAVFNLDKLNWYNSHYIRHMLVSELTGLCKTFVPDLAAEEYPLFEKIVELEQPRMTKLSDIREKGAFFFKLPDYESTLLLWKDAAPESTKDALLAACAALESLKPEEWRRQQLETMLLAEIEKNFSNKGSLLWPLRVALSGQKASPGPFEIMGVIGKDESLRRIHFAISKLEA